RISTEEVTRVTGHRPFPFFLTCAHRERLLIFQGFSGRFPDASLTPCSRTRGFDFGSARKRRCPIVASVVRSRVGIPNGAQPGTLLVTGRQEMPGQVAR